MFNVRKESTIIYFAARIKSAQAYNTYITANKIILGRYAFSVVNMISVKEISFI